MAAVGSVALWWIKRDFRLYDNPAYSRALAEAEVVLPVFFLEPGLIAAEDTGRFHGQAQYQALAALQRELAGEGGGARVLPCEVVEGLEQLWREQPFQAIYAHQETGVGYTFERDKAVIRWCRARGVRLVELPQNGVIRGLAARDGREKHWWGYMTAPRPGRAPLRPLPPELRARWVTSLAEERLAAYLAGRTGFPMIDACMRCLAATGFLNFRMRAMITSFACHALRLDWRLLHPPLARLWLDYEPGIHLAQLQMQAGVVGINTFRVYSPLKQLQDQDPQCRFVRRWLPELAGMTDEQILSGRHDLLAGVAPPIIDFTAETAVMKQFLYERKRSAENRAAQGAVLAKHGSRKAGKPAAPRRRSGGAKARTAVAEQPRTPDLFAGPEP